MSSEESESDPLLHMYVPPRSVYAGGVVLEQWSDDVLIVKTNRLSRIGFLSLAATIGVLSSLFLYWFLQRQFIGDLPYTVETWLLVGLASLGVIFSLALAFGTLFKRPIRLDRGRREIKYDGCFGSGWEHRLVDLLAIQYCRGKNEVIRSDDGRDKITLQYQVNLVFRDSTLTRRNVSEQKYPDRVKQIGQQLADFLEVPVVDYVGPSGTMDEGDAEIRRLLNESSGDSRALMRKSVATFMAIAFIAILTTTGGCFVDSPPKPQQNATMQNAKPATMDSAAEEGDTLKIEVIGTYRVGDAEYVRDQIEAILPRGIRRSSWGSGGNICDYQIPPIVDANTLAEQIRFGEVIEIQPRLIRVQYSYEHEVPERFKEDVPDWQKPPNDDLGPALKKNAGDWWKALGEIGSLQMRKRNKRGEITHLGFYSASDETMRHVANLKSLKELRLPGCRHVTDEGARHLSGLTNLEELDLSGTKIGNSGQVHLSSLTGLKRLELSGSGTEAGLKHLSSLTRLEFLSIGYSYSYPVTTEGLQYLQGMRNLKALHLDNCEVSDASLELIAGFSKLESLNLRSGTMTGAGLANLIGLGNLRELNLRDCRAIGDQGLASLGLIKSLGHLDLNGTKVSDAGIPNLQSLSNLSTLVLSETAITDAGVLALQPLPLLNWLSLDETAITDSSLAHLQSFPKLTAVCLSDTKITDEGLKDLGQMTRLKTLQIDGTHVTDVGMAHLSGLTELSSLDISNTAITERGLRHVRFAPNLRDIRAEESGVSQRTLERFKK
ncbi:leucine-rich repeat domain-containing protein [Aporhodopirellula aestuarii]|uniref:Internalin-A n=1 Tax=Aporhodopirellula aestuarii TaxID=2950107 RepID=A0ABT0U5X1_9BACT|nr:hypothetical protein [Aporhodopirellula aestuarii]MCM2372342.1 hypothetical protein [Aporhodopirellula aestuarii]